MCVFYLVFCSSWPQRIYNLLLTLPREAMLSDWARKFEVIKNQDHGSQCYLLLASQPRSLLPNLWSSGRQSAGICRGSDSLNTVRPAKAQEGPISDPEKLLMTLRLDTEAPTFQHQEDGSQSKKAVLLQEKASSGRSNDSRVIIHYTVWKRAETLRLL